MKANLSTLFFIVLSFLSLHCQGQDAEEVLTNKYYSDARNFIDKKKFYEAHESFKKIFKLKTTVPDELAYFYGYTLVNLNKYVQGKQALAKYIELKGDTGRYYHYAMDLMNLADCKEVGSYFAEETCFECHGEGKTMVKCRTCNGRGREICNLCGGVGVLKKRDNFGETFTTCTKCGGKGDHVCSKCNGSKLEKARCYVCDGKGKVKIKKECDALMMGGTGK